MCLEIILKVKHLELFTWLAANKEDGLQLNSELFSLTHDELLENLSEMKDLGLIKISKDFEISLCERYKPKKDKENNIYLEARLVGENEVVKNGDYASDFFGKKFKVVTDSEVCHKDQSARRVIDHFNKVTGSRITYAKGNVSKIKARMADGYSANDLIMVIDYKKAEWEGCATMSQYLRIATLFSSKFDGYFLGAKTWNENGRLFVDIRQMKGKKLFNMSVDEALSNFVDDTKRIEN